MYLLYVKFRLNDEGLKSRDNDLFNTWIHRFKWTLTTKAFFVMYAVVFAFSFMVVSAIMWGENMPDQPMFDLGVVSCAGDIFIYVAAVGAIELLFIIVFVVLLWKVRDAFAFKRELIFLFFTLFPIFILWYVLLRLFFFPPKATVTYVYNYFFMTGRRLQLEAFSPLACLISSSSCS